MKFSRYSHLNRRERGNIMNKQYEPVTSKKELQGQVKGVMKSVSFYVESNRPGQLMITDAKTHNMTILERN